MAFVHKPCFYNLQTKRQPNVTCLSVDHRHSSLWIGSSDGRVAIYAEPPNGHVIRAESTCLAVLHPFTGPVVRILLAPGSGECFVFH